MKKFAFVVALGMLIGTTVSSKADLLPYFGAEPYNGSYWNGPNANYGYTGASGWTGYNSYAQASCRHVRTRHISASGNVFYRTRRVCY